MPSNWMIVRTNPVTGRIGGFTHASGLTTAQVVEFLAVRTIYDPVDLARYAVGTPDIAPKLFQSAVSWLEEHSSDRVVSAWMAGAPAARNARQDKLREWWPALGQALDNLAARDAEA